MRLILVAMLISAGSCAGFQRGLNRMYGIENPESVRMSYPDGTTITDATTEDYSNSSLSRFVFREGDTVENWTEAVEIFNAWRSDWPKTVEGYCASIKEQGEANCPGGEWTILEQSNNSLTYERHNTTCGDFPAQISLNRILYGRSQIFHVMYTSRAELTAEGRARWLTALASAEIH